ncbi:SRPBCC family protein, partial [Burkholderia gladioli]|nr:SRPBCC family protein [Burkholderia gladioli]
MSNVSISVEIAAPADRVWAIVGGFNGLPAWLAPVRTSRLSDDGKTRHLEVGTDTRIVEQLLEHSDADRRTRQPFDPSLRLHAALRREAMARGLMVYPMGGT